MSTVKDLVHTLKTPIAIIELNLQRLKDNWQKFSNNLALENTDHIDSALSIIGNELQRLVACMDESNEASFLPGIAVIDEHYTTPLYYYFPTSVACIDDNPIFLNELQNILGNNTVAYVNNDPSEALATIQSLKMVDDLRETIFKHYDGDEIDSEQPITEFDISAIKDLIVQPDRFSRLSCVIVDFHMPVMDGLQFCEALNNVPVKKILLTGDADYERAVNAFNRGIIDCFILKNGRDMPLQLQAAIRKLEVQQFSDITRNFNLPLSLPLADDAFANLFNTWRQQNNIIEYYLLNKNRSYLGFSPSGEMSVLLVQDMLEKNLFYDIACAQNLAPKFCNQLKSPHFLLGLITPEELKIPVEDWPAHLYPASIFNNRNNTYCFSIINNESVSRFINEPITYYAAINLAS